MHSVSLPLLAADSSAAALFNANTSRTDPSSSPLTSVALTVFFTARATPGTGLCVVLPTHLYHYSHPAASTAPLHSLQASQAVSAALQFVSKCFTSLQLAPQHCSVISLPQPLLTVQRPHYTMLIPGVTYCHCQRQQFQLSQF